MRPCNSSDECINVSQRITMQVVARCKEDIMKARGVKPTLSPNLNVLATVEALDVKKLLFIGVGCQVYGSECLASHLYDCGCDNRASIIIKHATVAASL